MEGLGVLGRGHLDLDGPLVAADGVIASPRQNVGPSLGTDHVSGFL